MVIGGLVSFLFVLSILRGLMKRIVTWCFFLQNSATRYYSHSHLR
jgi:hypothetical protein